MPRDTRTAHRPRAAPRSAAPRPAQNPSRCDVQLPSIASNQNLTLNNDGSADLHFSPQPPAAGVTNWIKTVPGRGWFAALRLYGPTQVFFDRAWTPGDITKA
jgi:hypothetical protein